MNKIYSDILLELLAEPYINQRNLAKRSGYALGTVNKAVNELVEEGFLSAEFEVTQKAMEELKKTSPRSAIILAAGLGMRMVPINTVTPKALLKIHGEVMIERTIKQLQEAGIQKIYVVAGFMKEALEYLIDEYGVELIVNDKYMEKNNLHSLYLVRDYIDNSYIIPCDIYCKKNVFRKYEYFSWYMMGLQENRRSRYCVNRKLEIVEKKDRGAGNYEIGIAYLTKDTAEEVRKRLELFEKNSEYDDCFWEETLIEGNKWLTSAKVASTDDFIEINTYEQLRELDEGSDSLNSEAIELIEKVLRVRRTDIRDIEIVKKGMTNRSFVFSSRGKKYIMRVPDAETNELMNRQAETEIYGLLKGRSICDNCIYVNPDTGFKLAEFVSNARAMNPYDEEELRRCMEVVKRLHEEKLQCSYHVDFYKDLEHYEALWNGKPSCYKDYEQTKENIYKLRSFIERNKEEEVLCHIDANPDNFLMYTDEKGKEQIRLIDWEYAGMQDPDIDIACFIIYVMYDRVHTDRVIDIYFDGKCEPLRRIKIYAYMAIYGLQWSNWCECKRNQGIEFGEYALRQYRYAKDYYRVVVEELNKLGETL